MPQETGNRWQLASWLLSLAALVHAELPQAGGPPGEPPGVAGRPVLLELFTSQGCSSCPPADAVLRELARRPDVLALGFHVDYWDALGWADPFASPVFTARQHRYAQRQSWQVYTPQLVIDGRQALIGSRRAVAENGIAAARQARPAAAASIVRDGAAVRCDIGTVDGEAAAGEVWLISFDAERSTFIAAGENAGRRLVYPNVVRSIRKLGDWRNAGLSLREALRPDEQGERLALLVQGREGQVWALAVTPAR